MRAARSTARTAQPAPSETVDDPALRAGRLSGARHVTGLGKFRYFSLGVADLVGRVPYLYGNPLYYAFKRVVLEIAKNRTNAKLVPGVESMLPDAPMARFLALAEPQVSTQLAVIAGDIEGGGLLKRLGVLFTDYAFFCGVDNDLAVDTDSMYAGIAQR